MQTECTTLYCTVNGRNAEYRVILTPGEQPEIWQLSVRWGPIDRANQSKVYGLFPYEDAQSKAQDIIRAKEKKDYVVVERARKATRPSRAPRTPAANASSSMEPSKPCPIYRNTATGSSMTAIIL